MKVYYSVCVDVDVVTCIRRSTRALGCAFIQQNQSSVLRLMVITLLSSQRCLRTGLTSARDLKATRCAYSIVFLVHFWHFSVHIFTLIYATLSKSILGR